MHSDPSSFSKFLRFWCDHGFAAVLSLGSVGFQPVSAVLVRLRLHIRAFGSVKFQQILAVLVRSRLRSSAFIRISRVSPSFCGSDATAASHPCIWKLRQMCFASKWPPVSIHSAPSSFNRSAHSARPGQKERTSRYEGLRRRFKKNKSSFGLGPKIRFEFRFVCFSCV